jgi:hypothetical protein
MPQLSRGNCGRMGGRCAKGAITATTMHRRQGGGDNDEEAVGSATRMAVTRRQRWWRLGQGQLVLLNIFSILITNNIIVLHDYLV